MQGRAGRRALAGGNGVALTAKSYRFGRGLRLSGRRPFAAVYAAGAKQSRGPLVVYSKPNGLQRCRWGLSISRRVGAAVRRNRVKRLLRESIRILQHDVPSGYDLIVVVRPHEPIVLAEYQKLLFSLMIKSHEHWTQFPKRS